MAKAKDLTGQKFGRLTVIKRAENKGGRVCWLCKCECGNEKVIMGHQLKNGNTTSCGCLRSERMKQLNEEQWQDEEYRKMKSEKAKEQMKQQWQDEDFRKMKSEKMKQLNEEQWQDEEFRQKHSERSREQMKQQWQDEEYRKMQSEKLKEKWQDEDFRKMQSERAKEQWQDEDFRQMQIDLGKQRTGSKNYGWKGGVTPITTHLRLLYTKWHNDCKQQANYTCQLTGKRGNLHTHHLKAFSTIVLEAHQINNIEVKQQVKDYTEEELKLLEEYVGSWHKDNSNAVVLSEDVHNLFHSLYGKGENTPEQYIEFKERYLAGEFKEVLK